MASSLLASSSCTTSLKMLDICRLDQGRNFGSALGGYVGTMPDKICIARRKVFFSGHPLIFSQQPNFPDNQKKNATPPLTSLCTGPCPPRWFLFAEIGPTICCPLPDEASFLQNGRGVSPPHTPPGVSSLDLM